MRITYTFDGNGLFAEADMLHEADGIDRDASIASYRDELGQRLAAMFPDALVEVRNTDAYARGAWVIMESTDDCGTEDSVCYMIDELAGNVYDEGQFWFTTR